MRKGDLLLTKQCVFGGITSGNDFFKWNVLKFLLLPPLQVCTDDVRITNDFSAPFLSMLAGFGIFNVCILYQIQPGGTYPSSNTEDFV